MSIEESGKYVILCHNAIAQSNAKKTKEKHSSKHLELGRFYWIWAVHKILSDEFDEFLSWLNDQPDTKNLATTLRQMDRTAALQHMQEHTFHSEREIRNFIRWKHPNEKSQDILGMAQSNRIEEIRRTGIYCDLDRNLKLSRNPETLGQKEAMEWINHSGSAMMHMAVVMLLFTGKRPSFNIEGPSLPEEDRRDL
jgi:hypothetical protein